MAHRPIDHAGDDEPGLHWWEDLNGNGIQDSCDHFFLCPLLPPGRTET